MPLWGPRRRDDRLLPPPPPPTLPGRRVPTQRGPEGFLRRGREGQNGDSGTSTRPGRPRSGLGPVTRVVASVRGPAQGEERTDPLGPQPEETIDFWSGSRGSRPRAASRCGTRESRPRTPAHAKPLFPGVHPRPPSHTRRVYPLVRAIGPGTYRRELSFGARSSVDPRPPRPDDEGIGVPSAPTAVVPRPSGGTDVPLLPGLQGRVRVGGETERLPQEVPTPNTETLPPGPADPKPASPSRRVGRHVGRIETGPSLGRGSACAPPVPPLRRTRAESSDFEQRNFRVAL